MTSTIPTAAVTAPDTGTWTLDPSRSLVAFTTRHLFGLAGVRGAFAMTGGRVVVDAVPGESYVEATARTGSFDTGDARRDALVKGRRFLDAEAHPTVAFRSTGVSDEGGGRWVLRGELTAAGRTAPLDLLLTHLRQDGDVLHLQATGTVRPLRPRRPCRPRPRREAPAGDRQRRATR